MFFPRSVALALTPSRLHSLRLSLNTPVVTAEGLPSGPARAGLVVHDEPDGRPNVTLGVRSLRSGEVLLYSFDGDLRNHSSLDVGVDAALSFAESMGFLFDEEEVADRAEMTLERALGLWLDLMGDSEMSLVASEEHVASEPSEPLRSEPSVDLDPGLDGPGEGPELGLDDEEALESAFGPSEDFSDPTSEGYVPQFDGDLGADPDGFEWGAGLDDSGRLHRDGEATMPPGAVAVSPPPPGLETDAFAPQGELESIAEPLSAMAEASSEEASTGEYLDDDESEVEDDFVSAEPVEDDPPELALDLATEGVEIGREPPTLSKFRPSAPKPVEVKPKAALGRVKLVRRGSGDRPHPLLRLFGAF